MAYKNKEDQLACCRRWTKNNPAKITLRNRKQVLKRRGLTLESYKEKLESQNNACEICKSPDPRSKKGWHIDHDHTTGLTRGILCAFCNVMIGNAFDDPEKLKAGIEYLRKYANG